MLGLNILLDFLCEWLTLQPKLTSLLHISHLFAIVTPVKDIYSIKNLNYNSINIKIIEKVKICKNYIPNLPITNAII